jgi:hypothetical protein
MMGLHASNSWRLCIVCDFGRTGTPSENRQGGLSSPSQQTCVCQVAGLCMPAFCRGARPAVARRRDNGDMDRDCVRKGRLVQTRLIGFGTPSVWKCLCQVACLFAHAFSNHRCQYTTHTGDFRVITLNPKSMMPTDSGMASAQ